MNHVQISLLGGSSEIDRNKRYRSARYDFGTGPSAPTEFFAAALLRHIHPDRLVILGTSGSMWDVLLESLVPGDAHDPMLEELIDSASHDATSQAQLDALEPVLATKLAVAVRLRLIPYGRTLAEQVEILRDMAEDIPSGSVVSLDVTHGLRHLPMLAQMSALYLRKAKNVDIRGIYYGALNMTRDGVTPVMNLEGLLRIADWTGALHTFDKDGDYGVFEPLLADDLGESSRLLREAAFFERTSRPGDARGKLRKFRTAFEQTPPAGIGSLFADTLRARIAWIDQDKHYHRQRRLAWHYLATGDYLRAATMGFEAVLTRQVIQQGLGDSQDYNIREQAKKNLEAHVRRGDRRADAYVTLRDVRNAVAHGDRARSREIQQMLSSADRLSDELKRLFTILLPDE